MRTSPLLIVFLSILLLTSSLAAADNRLRGFVLGGGATLEEVSSLSTWKVNFIRYPINWVEADISTVAEFNTWLDNELATNVDPLITTAKSIGAQVLLDLHNPPGGYSDRGRAPTFRLFTEKFDKNGVAWQDAFIDVWKKIASRYRNEAGVWGYELLNEPADSRIISGVLKWPALAKKAITALREIDSEHMIVVNPSFGRASRINSMKSLVGPKVAVSILFYDPIPFTEQGLDIYRKTLKYPDKKRGYTKEYLEKKLKIAHEFSKKTKARVIVHEFGTVWYANGSYQWLRDVVSIFEKFKFDWTYFAFGGTVDVFDVDRPSSYDSKTPTKREKLIKKYLQKNTLASF